MNITTAAMRDLWTATWPALADDARVVALARAGNEDARERITTAYMGTVKRIVGKHLCWSDADDIRQAALLGIWQAVKEFDTDKGHRGLAATVQRNILHALGAQFALRFGLHVPTPQRLAWSQIRAEAARRVQDRTAHGDIDDVAAAIAPEFGLSSWDFEEIDAAAHGWARWHTLAPTAPTGPVPDVTDHLGRLATREREVIERRFGLAARPQETEDEAAASMAVTPRRVRQIQAAALTKLRAMAA